MFHRSACCVSQRCRRVVLDFIRDLRSSNLRPSAKGLTAGSAFCFLQEMSKFCDPTLQEGFDSYTPRHLQGLPGGVAERSKAAVLKTAERKLRGFESLLLRRL